MGLGDRTESISGLPLPLHASGPLTFPLPHAIQAASSDALPSSRENVSWDTLHYGNPRSRVVMEKEILPIQVREGR